MNLLQFFLIENENGKRQVYVNQFRLQPKKTKIHIAQDCLKTGAELISNVLITNIMNIILENIFTKVAHMDQKMGPMTKNVIVQNFKWNCNMGINGNRNRGKAIISKYGVIDLFCISCLHKFPVSFAMFLNLTMGFK